MVILLTISNSVYAHKSKTEGTIGPTDLEKLLGKIQLLDIRNKEEYEKEHIDTAIVIPLKEISEARLTDLGFKKGDELVVYADSDIPAKKAKVLLEVMGFSVVKILSGGLVHWKEDGFPTVSGKMLAEPKKITDTSSSVSLQPTEHDFGIIGKKDGVVRTTFSPTNTGNETVTIEEIATSCGCTSVEVSENVILPGKAISLNVFFDPNFHKEPQGKFSRTVFIQTSEGIELQTKIHVRIKE